MQNLHPRTAGLHGKSLRWSPVGRSPLWAVVSVFSWARCFSPRIREVGFLRFGSIPSVFHVRLSLKRFWTPTSTYC